MAAWYEQVFEAKVQYRNPALAFLMYDDEHPPLHRRSRSAADRRVGDFANRRRT